MRPVPIYRWLFAYGSLQPGAYNYDAWFGRNEPEAQPAYATGQVAPLDSSPDIFPVARFDVPGRVVGTLLRVDVLSPVWVGIYDMEWNTGYHLVEVDVVAVDEHGPRDDTALAFEYDLSLSPRVPLEDGDWLRWYLAG